MNFKLNSRTFNDDGIVRLINAAVGRADGEQEKMKSSKEETC
jgi:hypothetical protein